MMNWEERKKKILELRVFYSNSKGEWDEQVVQNGYEKWLTKTPSAIDYHEMACNDIGKADREDRPDPDDTGSLFGEDPSCTIPWEKNKRVTIEKAGARHFRGWLTVQAKNHAAQSAAFARVSEHITRILDLFEQHPECRTWGALRRKCGDQDMAAD